MDVFEAVDSRMACRWFPDKPVDQKIVRDLIEVAGRAASNGKIQPWNVYALTRKPLGEFKRQAADVIETSNWRDKETEYPIIPENFSEPYSSRLFGHGDQLYGALGMARDDHEGRTEQRKRGYQFFNAPVGLFITIDRRLGPGRWADHGCYVATLAMLARGHGLDSCPQAAWIRLYELVGDFLKLPAEQMLYIGMGIGYRDGDHPVNRFRSERADVNEFCKFYGFD